MPLRPRLAAAVGLALTLASARARAQQTCADSYERGQELRRAGQLSRARSEMRLCEHACPTRLGDECSGWRREVEADLASVALSVTDAAGRLLVKVRVMLDGAPLLDEIPAQPLDLDPGKHRLVFEGEAGARAEVSLDLATGEKRRAVSVRLVPPAPPPAPPPPREPPPASRSPLSYVLGGVGLAGLALGAGLGIKGQIDKANLEGSCAPRCDRPTQVDPIAREWWAGAGSAAAGGVLLVTGIVVWAVEGRSRAPARVTLVPGPGNVVVIGRF